MFVKLRLRLFKFGHNCKILLVKLLFSDLQLLKFGPYHTNYSRNGRYLVMGGQKGHLAVLDCMRMRISAEVQLEDAIYDVKYLHNETMFAVAQKKYTYV